MFKNKKLIQIISWASYEWACDAFPIIITTFIFSTYFTSKVASNPIVGTHEWANTAAIAGVMIAITSPIFGAIADHWGHHKKWLMGFSYLNMLFTSLLWFVYPHPSSVLYELMIVAAATICFEIAFVFYNSFLPHIAPKGYMGRVSGWGWGSGYAGGIIALTICFLGFIEAKPSWLDTSSFEQVRISAFVTAIWFLIFSLPLFILVPDTPATGLPIKQAIKVGLGELFKTIKSLPQQKNMLIYLIAHLVYTDGLNTLFAFGGIYAAGTFGLSIPEVVVFGISMNITAGIGAVLFAWVDDWIGSKRTIILSLISLIGLGLPILFVHSIVIFWILGLILSLFLGPVQAASRSLMAHITPEDKISEMFGLYSLSGRATAFAGPWLFGLATASFQTQRAGMAVVLFFFFIGGILMFFVQNSSEEI